VTEHPSLDGLVRQLCRGARRRPRQGKGRCVAADRSDLVGVACSEDGHKETVPAKDLRKGDIVRVEKDNVMRPMARLSREPPSSTSPPSLANRRLVLKEPEPTCSRPLTAGTTIISDWLLIRVTTNPGDTFLDRMIRLVERSQTAEDPNEIALTVLLDPDADFRDCRRDDRAGGETLLQAQINVADLVALLVALIPTTIGALLSAIGIAAIDRTMRFNVLAMSARQSKQPAMSRRCILDKTGTITTGNREANDFIAVHGLPAEDLIQAAFSGILFRYDAGRPIRRLVQCGARRSTGVWSSTGEGTGLFSADPA